MTDFPTQLTNAIDNITKIVAKHLNNLEKKVGIDNSEDEDSHDYKIKQLEATIALNFADNETPSETPNGVIKVFTLAHTPNPVASLDFKIEGVSLIRDSAEPNGYSVSINEVTTITAPPTGAKPRASYRY